MRVKLIAYAILGAVLVGVCAANAATVGNDYTQLQNCCTKAEDQSNAAAAGSNCEAWRCPSGTILRTLFVCTSCNTGYFAGTETIQCENNTLSLTTCTKSGLGGFDRVCSQGQYSNGVGGCASCPSDGYGNAGTTSGTGATSISECYIPAGSVFSDSTGSGVYNSDCSY